MIMKKTFGTIVFTVAAAIVFAASTSHAQTAAQSIDKPFVHPAWSGVWQAKLDGIPAVELTLADDAGEPNGTIVFHAIKNNDGHPFSFSTEPHTLIQPRMNGNVLSFQVKRGNGSAEILNMSVELEQDGNIKFACSNCGPEGTKADMERMQ
jgi:hypothetical protein